MSNLMLNLDELNVPHEQSEHNRMKIYDDILKSCHNKIQKYNKEFKKQECLFEPPTFIIGKPPYNYVDLVNYLITSLRNNGLRAEWLPDRRSLYVSWKKSDVDMDKYHQHFTNVVYTSDVNTSDVNISDSSQQLSMFEVKPFERQNQGTKRRKKVNDRPPPQHMAMFEYRPGIRDLVPVNLKGIT
jgi:hypothetical protein